VHAVNVTTVAAAKHVRTFIIDFAQVIELRVVEVEFLVMEFI
jgi:hypothetical protein